MRRGDYRVFFYRVLEPVAAAGRVACRVVVSGGSSRTGFYWVLLGFSRVASRRWAVIFLTEFY